MSFKEFLNENLNEGKKLSTKDKAEILKDFKEWSGGSTPEEAGQDDVEKYIESSLSTKYDTELAKEYLIALV
jgi:uncharacterized membrane protein